MQQPNIARLEGENYDRVSLPTLKIVARALGASAFKIVADQPKADPRLIFRILCTTETLALWNCSPVFHRARVRRGEEPGVFNTKNTKEDLSRQGAKLAKCGGTIFSCQACPELNRSNAKPAK